MKKNKFISEKTIGLFMILLAMVLSVKYIFFDWGIDAEYQVIMAHRLATGDIMFKEMWEPHQTSAFLCAFFIKIYQLLFGTMTGIVIYLQFIGVLLDGLISFFLYRVVKKYTMSKKVAFGMAWVFFVISPKDVPIAEFANMEVWSCMLLCLMLFLFFETAQRRYLILAALSLCIAVLSYPSCMLILVGVGILFVWQKSIKSLFVFAGICALTGLIYLSMIFQTVTVKELIFCIENMLMLEPSHTIGMGEKIVAYVKDAIFILSSLVIIYILSLLFAKLLKKGKILADTKVFSDILFFLITLLVCLYTVLKWQVYNRCWYSLIFFAIIIIGIRYVKKLSGSKLCIYMCGTIVSIFNFVATLLLTDLNLISSVPYLLIAVIMAFLPISESYKNVEESVCRYWIAIALISGVLFLTFRNIYIIRPMHGHNQSILKVGGIVKSGPAMGVISEYMGSYMQNESIKEWEQYIDPGSNIYIIGGAIDTLGYLYSDTNIAAPSVMSTPSYNESISQYWNINPKKYPDVVIASCWYGELDEALKEKNWILKWIDEDFKPQYHIDGKYWRYYFR